MKWNIGNMKDKTLEEQEDYWKNRNLDGIICKEKFEKETTRILFLGHEPWVKTEADYNNYQGEIDFVLTKGENPTGGTYLANACDIAAGLLSKERKGCLFYTALINLKKSPRIGSNELSLEVSKACEYNRDFLFNQLKEINPTIIIASNVLDGKERLWNPWEEYRNDCLLYILFNNNEFNQIVSNSNIDFYIEKNSGMLLIDVPHLASGRYGDDGFKQELIPTIVRGYKEIEDEKYEKCEDWISRRERR